MIGKSIITDGPAPAIRLFHLGFGGAALGLFLLERVAHVGNTSPVPRQGSKTLTVGHGQRGVAVHHVKRRAPSPVCSTSELCFMKISVKIKLSLDFPASLPAGLFRFWIKPKMKDHSGLRRTI